MKKALATVDGISDVDCDTSDRSCTFKAPAGFDVDKALNELVEGGKENGKMKNWSKN